MNPLVHLLACLSACVLQVCAYGNLPPPQYSLAQDNGSEGYYPSPELMSLEQGPRPPIFNFLKWSPECDDGKMFFITPRGWAIGRPGPMILDSRGELVWSHHFENKFGGQAYDLKVQKYQGQDYLTFWLGDDRIRGHGSGAYYMLNASYHIVRKVDAANGLRADLHEFLITPDDTALMTVYQVVKGNVTAYRSFNPEKIPVEEQNFVWDCLVQEIDLRTGELLFEWRATEHMAIEETFRNIYDGGHKKDPWDWFHLNSIEKDELGNYLVSARYPHSITYIDGKTKDTIWQLGGKENDFLDASGGAALDFAWQHDARFHKLDTFPDVYQPPRERPGYTTKLVTVFDNAAEDQHFKFGVEVSRGLLLEVTYPTPGTTKALTRARQKPKQPVPIWEEPQKGPDDEKPDFNAWKVEHINRTDPDWTVRVIQSYDNPAPFRASSQGSMQVIDQPHRDPKMLVGYGLNAAWTEFDSNGTVLCDVHYGARTSWERGDIQSYRVHKGLWKGRPQWKPSIEISDDDMVVYVSWVGATDVVDWVLQASDTGTDDDSAWADVRRVHKTGFETIIAIPPQIGGARWIRAMALTENSRRLDYGVSRVIDRGLVAAYFPKLNKKLPPDVAHMSRMRVFFIIVLNVSALLILYEIWRRLIGRRGRAGIASVRWRKGPAHPILGES